MAHRLHYFARPVFWIHGRLQGGEPMPFLSAQDAEDGGAIIAKMADGAVVYQVLGDPDFDLWEEPELLATFGQADATAILAA